LHISPLMNRYPEMNSKELKDAIQNKMNELEVAMELGKPHHELLKLYRQLKELQYQKTILEASKPASNLVS
jgi:ribosomal 50S subunit-associated protein YjgA (DUF615 family)